MPNVLKVSGPAEIISDDDHFTIQCRDQKGESVEIQISGDDLHALAVGYQEHAIASANVMSFPAVHLKSFGAAHDNQTTQLMLTSEQAGTFVYIASDAQLHGLQQEIGRILTLRSGPQTRM